MYRYTYFPCSGLNFVSGGADKVVIIWTSDPPDGRLKYTHSDSVQCISYNPVSQQLVSCTATEVGERKFAVYSCIYATMYVHIYFLGCIAIAVFIGFASHLLSVIFVDHQTLT